MKKSEILAPVGGKDSLFAAVRAGADAVYFGATQFNARRNADNFNDEDIKQAIDYCRVNDVRCYLTLNTLIKDLEMDEALELVNKVWCYGIDAVIVQDLGLAKLLHQKFPMLALHGSTQLSIHSAAALPLLKQLGFKRVVTAREMSGDELRAFCAEAGRLDIEVEAFIHGALCMCLSGQCYFSAFLGGRSANRGLCAGTCRLPFAAKGGTGYDLSLKDLSLVPYLDELTKMGVTSFKIEGRMKGPEYVAAAVDAVRQMVDFSSVSQSTSALLEKVFSRDGFTDGYYNNNLGRDMFGIRTEQAKQLSNEAMSSLHDLYRHERQRHPIEMQFVLNKGQPAVLSVKSGEKEVTVIGDIAEEAVNRPLTDEQAVQALSKLGGTCYYAAETLCTIDDGVTLPIAKIKALRKAAVQQLNEGRIVRRTAVDLKKVGKSAPCMRSLKGYFVRFCNMSQFKEVVHLLDTFKGYSLPAEMLVTALNGADDGLKKILQNAYAELARGSSEDERTTELLLRLKGLGINKVVCSNLGAVQLARENGLDILGGFGLNVFNSHSLEQIYSLGIKGAVISTELSLSEIKGLAADSTMDIYAMCYGRQPLMLTRNCPVKNGIGCKGRSDGCFITDRKRERFPVICHNGYSEVLNCRITDISDLSDELSADYGYIYLTLEEPREALNVISDFINKRNRSGGELTRGLFKMGVK